MHWFEELGIVAIKVPNRLDVVSIPDLDVPPCKLQRLSRRERVPKTRE